MRLPLGLAASAILALCSGCASIHSTSISEIDRGPGHRINAADSGTGVLLLSVPTLDAAARLKALCAGKVTGVQTVTSMRNWFVVQRYRQEASGWCQNP